MKNWDVQTHDAITSWRHDVAKRFRALPDMISPVLWAKTFFWPADRRDYVKEYLVYPNKITERNLLHWLLAGWAEDIMNFSLNIIEEY